MNVHHRKNGKNYLEKLINDSNWLLKFKKDIHSQGGEDGIIRKVLSILPKTDKWCVEFGAWDGFFLNNTRSLITKHNYSAVLIEADSKKFVQLKENYKNHKSRVYCRQTFVRTFGKNKLDCILKTTPIPRSFDFLSVDIDGNDYYIWKSLINYRPKVVCIEYNDTIPNEVEYIQNCSSNEKKGTSIRSLVSLANIKGYELICVTSSNAFFVMKKYFPLFKIRCNDIRILRSKSQSTTFLFSGYDGKLILAGLKKLPWHNLIICEKKIQVLPNFLQKFIANYSLFDRVCLRILIFLRFLRTNRV